VEAVGSDVTYVKPGDHVITCLSVFCGQCDFCISGRPNLCTKDATRRPFDQPQRLSKADGTPVFQFLDLSSFAEQMLVHEGAVVKIRDDMPLDRAALIGCGVTTGPGDGRALDGREADATATDDGHGLAGPHAGGVEHGAEAGRHAAADERGAIEGHVVADLHDGTLVHEHLLGEGGQVEELEDRRTVLRETLGLVERAAGAVLRAQVGLAGDAEVALAAEHREAGDHVVTGLDVGDVGPDRLDDAGRLVAEHGGRRIRVLALHEVQVGVAAPGRGGLDEHLPWAGLVDLHVVDDELARDLLQNGSLHVSP
ncbi:MAG TPA: alcohol dehydrogenase catalytic domain-containing protein, partial [Acidimicrobiales bacterium]|nr:alcohol dehydrogenase catalytic domain-containing protein [Acidimicrobiales bacterium]